MSLDTPLKLGYGWLVLQGLLAALAPRKAIVFATGAWRLGFENVGDLEPREWYVRATRAVGVGLLAAGLTGLLLVGRDRDEAEPSDTASEGTPDDDGPVRVDIG
jgi:hypothetical protein